MHISIIFFFTNLLYNIVDLGSEIMKELFISTYDENIIIGLFYNNKLIAHKEKQTIKTHSVYLIPLIEEILKENDLETTNLNSIIVVNGPGSFTGIRLGVTVGKMLAYTLNIPIKLLTSIEAIAYSNKISNKIVELSDSKGKYIGIFENNKLIKDIVYLKNDLVEEYIKDYNYEIINNKIDLKELETIISDIEVVNTHKASPIYIKELEALSDK